jgi:hypothetical protein
MRKLLGLVVLLAALLAVAELLAPSWVAAQAEAAVAAETRDRVVVDVDVSGPPLLIPVALDGTVDRWRMRVAQVAGRDVPVEVVIDLDEVELDRGRLVRGDVVVRSVDTARATIRFDLSGSVPPALQGMADRLAEVGMGPLFDALGGDQVGGADDRLVLGELSMPLVPGSCELSSQDLVVTADCELREVPSFLLRAFD